MNRTISDAKNTGIKQRQTSKSAAKVSKKIFSNITKDSRKALKALRAEINKPLEKK